MVMAERDGEIIAGGYDQVADEYGLPGIDPHSPAVRTAARVCGAGGAGNIEIGG